MYAPSLWLGCRLFATEVFTCAHIFPLKKNHFLYLDWLIIREFYINLQRILIHDTRIRRYINIDNINKKIIL